MKEVADGLSIAHFAGDDGLSAFLSVGAAGEAALGAYVRAWLAGRSAPAGETGAGGDGIGFGCSTLTVRNVAGEVLFGRNLDWARSSALILTDAPASGDYASVSTVNLEVMRYCGIGDLSALTEEDFLRAALYFPLDGMNEMGFALSVNMIKDAGARAQETSPGKTPVNFTAAIRLLLNRAATVAEAVALLGDYNLCVPGGGQLFHFAMADRTGKSVVVEFIDGKTYVTDTPAVTNFYLTPNVVSGTDKYGIGTDQSVQRYDTLMAKLAAASAVSDATQAPAAAPHEIGAAPVSASPMATENTTATPGAAALPDDDVIAEAAGSSPCLSADDVRDALASVAKSNFDVPGASTEWSVIFNLSTGDATYYRREDWSAPIPCRVPGTGREE